MRVVFIVVGDDEMNTHKRRQRSDRDVAARQISRGSELSSLVVRCTGLVDNLERAVSQLPHVDSYGYSSCPPKVVFELYARKEKCEREVASYISTLTEILALLEKEVERYRKNLDRIRTDAGRLHRDEAKEKYSQAEQAQELELRRARDEKDAVYMVLRRAEVALKISRDHQIPDVRRKEPAKSEDQKGDRRDLPISMSTDRGDPSPGSELDGLISLGPWIRR